MGKAVQRAPAGKPGTGTVPAGRPEDGRRIHYERRRPEETTLYQLVQEHLETLRPRRAKQALPWAWLSWPKSSLRPGRDCQSLSKRSSRPFSNAVF
ncbi:MAG: hypothetical protein ACREV1_19595 [Gammaproteobacteria bacterium]